MHRIVTFLVALSAAPAAALAGPAASPDLKVASAAVLDPSTLVMIGTGLIGIALVRSRYNSDE